MITPTHLLFSQACFYTACIFTGHGPTVLEAGAAAAASLIPDLDSRQSLIGRMFYPLAAALEHEFGHRTFTHSLLIQITAGAIAFYLLPFGFFLALVAGWVSHSWADMMTAKGVCWFWPSRVRCVLPGNARFRMDVMGWGELWFAALMTAAVFPLHAMAVTAQGATGLIRQAIGEVSAARATYDAQKGGHVWWLEVEGNDNLTLAPVQGRFEVLAGFQESGFLLKTPNGRKTACKALTCDWHTSKAVIHKGEPQAATTYTVTREALDGAALQKAVAELASAGDVYVTGTAQTIDPKEAVELRFVAPAEIPAVPLAQVNLSVQVRHAPTVPGPALTIPDATPPKTVRERDPLLEKWLRQ